MSSIPTRTPLLSWTAKQLKDFIIARGESLTGLRRKENLVNKVLELQLKEHLVDSTINTHVNINQINDNLSDSNDRIVISRSELKSIIQQAILEQQTSHSQEQQVIEQRIATQPASGAEEELNRDRLEEFLMSQLEKTKNDEDRHVSGIKRDLRKGS